MFLNNQEYKSEEEWELEGLVPRTAAYKFAPDGTPLFCSMQVERDYRRFSPLEDSPSSFHDPIQSLGWY
jgi:hypothetical protein